MSQDLAGTPSRADDAAAQRDGRVRPLIDAGAAYTVLAGLASLVLGALNTAHLIGSALGVTGFAVGVVAQMVSVTRNERVVIVCGIVASFVGMGLGIAHGGFG